MLLWTGWPKIFAGSACRIDLRFCCWEVMAARAEIKLRFGLLVARNSHGGAVTACLVVRTNADDIFPG
jgi:hypothetical protein